MKYKLAFGTGAAIGYYFGAKAGRERFEQIDRSLQRLRHHPTVEAVADRIGAAVEARVGKAKDAVATSVRSKVDSVVVTARNVLPGRTNGNADGSPNGTATIPTAANRGSACP